MERSMDIFPWLFGLALVTVIGHGIWVLLAAIFRALFVESKPPSGADGASGVEAKRAAQCVVCGAVSSADDIFCHFCGQPRTSAGPIAELALTARQLDKFLAKGRLDAETHKLVMDVIDEERAGLTTPVRPKAIEAPRETEAVPVASSPIAVNQLSEAFKAPYPQAAPAPTAVNQLTDASQAASPQATPSAVEQEVFIVEPRRSFAEMLESFMEESSIRWGELIGGLLIVGGSIALVVSQWSDIAARPFMKFSIFIGVTTALFGLGFYSAHRWKLPTTSRGALIISTLLAPLNFLAMTAFSHETVPASPPVIGGELFSLALFFFLVYQAARVFAPAAPWMTALATMGPSFTMLMAKHSSGAQEGWLRVAMLGVAPLLCYFVSCGVILRARVRTPESPESDDREADQVFTHLGVSSFAALLPLGLLFIKPGYVSQTLRQFAPLIGLFGIPAIATSVALLQGADENK